MNETKTNTERLFYLAIGLPIIFFIIFIVYTSVSKFGVAGIWERHFEGPVVLISPYVCSLIGVPFVPKLLKRLDGTKRRYAFLGGYIVFVFGIYYVVYSVSKVFLAFK